MTPIYCPIRNYKGVARLTLGAACDNSNYKQKVALVWLKEVSWAASNIDLATPL